ncbi:MAG: hypothetical protein HKN67_11055, partial [Saprospiraceae bacterium]|nr:hypothetical protein [Saprospiraceae bacterium]
GYGFTVYHTYFQTLNISSQINLASDDAREKQNGDVEDDKNEHKITKSGDDMINAFRFNNITLPSNALVNSAYITFTAKGDKNNTVAEVLIQGQDNTADAPTFLDCGGGCSDITVRDKTFNSVTWVIPPIVKDLTYDTPDLSAIIQEIIDDQSGISNAGVAFITEGQGPDYEERAFYSFDGDPTKAPILNINYTVPGDQPFNYVITIEETDLPVDAMMSTDNLETSSLYFDGVSDCENNFGYYLPGCKTIYTNGFLKYNAAR